MKAFRVTGNYADPRQRQPFSIEMAAEDEAAVRLRRPQAEAALLH